MTTNNDSNGAGADYETNTCDLCLADTPVDEMEMVDNSSEYMEICYQCYQDSTMYCQQCDDTFTEQNIMFCDGCSGAYCEWCYENERFCCSSYGEGRDYVNNYSHKPKAIFHARDNSENVTSNGLAIGTAEPSARPSTMYYGVELELMSDTGDVGELADFIALQTSERYAYLKEDGSLGEEGVEIVTHPATIDHHVNLFPWKTIIDASLEDGLFEDDSAGVHVHLSRGGLAPTRAEQANVGTNLLAVTEIFFPEIYDIAKRDSSSWAARNMQGHGEFYEMAKMCKAETPIDCVELHNELHDYGKTANGRYSAVNFSNSETIEFRIFRSTQSLQELLACIELVDTLVHIAKTHDLNEIIRLTFDDVLETTIELGHDNLFNEWASAGRV